MQTILLNIAEAAIRAPSVDNCQPWRLALGDRHIDLFLDCERAEFFGDYAFSASYVTMGAVLENMSIACSHAGYGSNISYFPNPSMGTWIARFNLLSTQTINSDLYQSIWTRSTNRSPFRKTPLDVSAMNRLTNLPEPSGLRFFLSNDVDVMQDLCSLSKQIDEIIFGHQLLHANLFKWIRWNKAEAEATRDGLPVSSLGLTPPEVLFFRLISSWKRMSFLNLLGIHKIIAAINSGLLLKAGALGFITMHQCRPEDYLEGGRFFQRVWLLSEAMGVTLQPFGGLPFLLTRYIRGKGEGFDESQRKALEHIKNRIMTVLDISENNALIGFFRVGIPTNPCNQTLRRPISDIIPK